jgi:hypothetical protein
MKLCPGEKESALSEAVKRRAGTAEKKWEKWSFEGTQKYSMDDQCGIWRDPAWSVRMSRKDRWEGMIRDYEVGAAITGPGEEFMVWVWQQHPLLFLTCMNDVIPGWAKLTDSSQLKFMRKLISMTS